MAIEEESARRVIIKLINSLFLLPDCYLYILIIAELNNKENRLQKSKFESWLKN